MESYSQFLITSPASTPDSLEEGMSVNEIHGNTMSPSESPIFDSDFGQYYQLPNDTSLFSREILYNFPIGIVVLLAVAYGLVSLTAVVGNTIVICYVVGSRRLRTVTNNFIANLAVADILIGAFSIPFQFQAALLQKWVLPSFMCPFCTVVQVVSVNVSIFTLVAIAADRYLVVVTPLKYRISKGRARLIIVVIWIIALLTAAPAAYTLRVKMVPVIDDQGHIGAPAPLCTNVSFSRPMWLGYNQFLVAIQYFIPLAVVIFAYARMAGKLRGSALHKNKRLHFAAGSGSVTVSIMSDRGAGGGENGPLNGHETNFRTSSNSSYQCSKGNLSGGNSTRPSSTLVTYSNDVEYIVTNKKKVIKMLIIIVALFALCWLPLQTYTVLSGIFPEINQFRYINAIWFCCHWLAMSNSSVNPFIYAIYTLK
ncbi:RYamide receptor-like [Brevipalpus obovatus]|uniref:RYamide receptor-like n=1 Tax=Brevipalpus obovatus TaxID=246614 RepID=UPI003D9E6A93